MLRLFDDCQRGRRPVIGGNRFDFYDANNLPLAFVESPVCRDQGRIGLVDDAGQLAGNKFYNDRRKRRILEAVAAGAGDGMIAGVIETLRDMPGDIFAKRLHESRKSPRLAAVPVGFVPRIACGLADIFDFLSGLAACDRGGLHKKLSVRLGAASKKKFAKCHASVMPRAPRRKVSG
jgi:hypothetical protein